MHGVRIPKLIRAAMLAAAFAFLAGCGGGTEDLQAWVQAEKKKPGPPLEPLPVLKTFETFEYKDQDQRDPFGPSLEEQREAAAAAGSRPDQHPKEPLEQFPLDSLKMVGTIGTGSGMEGLLKDPDGVIHRVHLHNYAGQNNGKITAIAEDHIDLVELVPNGSGGWMERPQTVALGGEK
jgi:type IV pilus assembly protein PilP